MTNDYVTVPREPTPEMCSAFTAVCCECQAATHIIARRMWQAMLAAAPPHPAAASVRARGLVTFVEQMDMLRVDAQKWHDGDPKYPFSVIRDSLIAALNAYDEARTLLAPAADERAASSEAAVADQWEVEIMHNGSLGKSPPSEYEHADYAVVDNQNRVIVDTSSAYHRFNRYEREAFCELIVRQHNAPTTADAGVTWEQASKADRIYWEHRDNGAIAEDAMRAALEAALGAREGK